MAVVLDVHRGDSPSKPTRRARAFGGALGVMITAASRFASAQAGAPCESPVLSVDQAEFGADWLCAIESLRTTVHGRSSPWTCGGGTIRLRTVGVGEHQVEVTTVDGRHTSRHVSLPDDLSPTVEALLVSEIPPDLAAAHESDSAPHNAGTTTALAVTPLPRASRRTNVFLNAALELGVRVLGPSIGAIASMRFHASVCIEHWCLGGWGRYDGVGVALVDPPTFDRLSIEAIGAGIDAAWTVSLGPGRLDLGPTFGLTRVEEIGSRNNTILASMTVQTRIGAAVRWRTISRGVAIVLALDADGSLGEISGDPDGFDPQLPSPPTWSTGASVGVGFGGLL